MGTLEHIFVQRWHRLMQMHNKPHIILDFVLALQHNYNQQIYLALQFFVELSFFFYLAAK